MIHLFAFSWSGGVSLERYYCTSAINRPNGEGLIYDVDLANHLASTICPVCVSVLRTHGRSVHPRFIRPLDNAQPSR
jgi:hypothetical protein